MQSICVTHGNNPTRRKRGDNEIKYYVELGEIQTQKQVDSSSRNCRTGAKQYTAFIMLAVLKGFTSETFIYGCILLATIGTVLDNLWYGSPTSFCQTIRTDQGTETVCEELPFAGGWSPVREPKSNKWEDNKPSSIAVTILTINWFVFDEENCRKTFPLSQNFVKLDNSQTR
ncbi:Protein of unknown function [Gryllus bimaculatus]|nr:Protein of unknown function [Gryllus bimaculatus]